MQQIKCIFNGLYKRCLKITKTKENAVKPNYLLPTIYVHAQKVEKMP